MLLQPHIFEYFVIVDEIVRFAVFIVGDVQIVDCHCARLTFVNAPTVANRPPDFRRPVAFAFAVSPRNSAITAKSCFIELLASARAFALPDSMSMDFANSSAAITKVGFTSEIWAHSSITAFCMRPTESVDSLRVLRCLRFAATSSVRLARCRSRNSACLSRLYFRVAALQIGQSQPHGLRDPCKPWGIGSSDLPVTDISFPRLQVLVVVFKSIVPHSL